MRIFKYLFLLTIAMTIAVSSCNKDGANKSKKDILTSHKWKYFSFKTNGTLETLLDCEKDDFVKFEVNGTYTYDPTNVKCGTYDVIQDGTWSMSSDEKTITLDGSPTEIVELTDSKFVMKIVDGTDILESTYVAF